MLLEAIQFFFNQSKTGLLRRISPRQRGLRSCNDEYLDANNLWPYHAAMIIVATTVIARRRRILAAGADVFV